MVEILAKKDYENLTLDVILFKKQTSREEQPEPHVR